MFDSIAIVALVISIASAIFVAIKEGIGLSLEYRESETTSRRKKEIDNNLREEVKEELRKFLEKPPSKKQSEEEEEAFESVEELGRCAFFARSITSKILDDIGLHIKQAFRCLAAVLIGLFFALIYGSVFITTFSDWIVGLILASYIIITLVSSVWVSKNLRKYHLLRDRFLRLYENPSLEYCRELTKELKDKGLW